MSVPGLRNNFNCAGFAIVSAVIIGVVTALLRITAVITLTPAFLWTVLGIAVVYLAVNLLVASTGGDRTLVLTGILGTILLSIVLLAVDFVATSVVGAIIAGALLLFFWLMIASTACLVKCLSDRDN